MDDSKKHQDAETKKGSRSIKLVRSLGIASVCLGLSGMALPFVNGALIAHNSRLVDLEDYSQERLAIHRSTPAPFDDHASIEEIGYINFWKDLGKYQEEEIVGGLYIPSIEIALPIFKNPSNANLLAGVGELTQGIPMGEGNYSLSGHRAHGKGVLLHNLMDAKKGATMYVTDKKKIYVYTVVDTVETQISAVERLDQDQVALHGGSPILSVMTCYYGKSASRWFVIGSLTATLDYEEGILSQEYAAKEG